MAWLRRLPGERRVGARRSSPAETSHLPRLLLVRRGRDVASSMSNSPWSVGRVRVKICGITRIEDALDAAGVGADAIGLVFYPPSARALAPAQAAKIIKALPPFLTVVGLFLDPEPAAVRHVLERLPLDLLQFHGRESGAFCESFARPYIKAIAMGGGEDPVSVMREHPHAAGFVLDSHVAGAAGGSGETFDWRRVPVSPRPLIVAGGLTMANVARVVRDVRPWAVDVSSGVESDRGIKDREKMCRFIEEVGRASIQ